ncbi:MAG: hypothetical protein ACLFQX_12120 [Candidatus Kapaibacterium sp.]
MKLFIAFLFSILMVIASPGTALAQGSAADTTKDDDFSELEMHEDWDMEFWSATQVIDFEMPTIELMIGQSQPKYSDNVFTGEFFEPIQLDARIGYSGFERTDESPSIIEYHFSYLFLSNISNNVIEGDVDPGQMEVSAWRFGMGSSDGYGWALGDGDAAIVLYHGTDLAWTKLDFKNEPASENKEAIEVFGDAIRFGEQFESGIKIRMAAPVSLTAGYQRMIVYPRHMFWYWSLSKVIEGVGEGIAESFSEAVLESSPGVAPIVNFLLKGAISYGLYELRADKMNWPVNTVPPMMFDNYKVGITLTF